MNTLGRKINTVTWFARLTGASTEILRKCSSTCRNAFTYLGMTIGFTAILSALVVGYAMATLTFHNMAMYPVIFLIWFVFIYLYDRLVVIANNKSVRLVRFMTVLVLALFHSYVFDTLTMSSDIVSQFKTEYNVAKETVRSRFNEQHGHRVAMLHQEISSLEEKNQAINERKRSYIDSLVTEANGHGGSGLRGTERIYKNLERLKDEYAKMADIEIRSNSGSIEEKRSEIGRLLESSDKEVDLIPKPEEQGLMRSVQKMHELVFHGNITVRLFFFLYFGIFCFLEALPALAKMILSDDLVEYFNEAKRRATESGHERTKKHENAIKEIDRRQHYEWLQTETSLNIQHQLATAQITAESFLERLRIDEKGIENRLAILEEFLMELEQLENRLRESFPQYYKEYINSEIERARKEFANSWNRYAHGTA